MCRPILLRVSQPSYFRRCNVDSIHIGFEKQKSRKGSKSDPLRDFKYLHYEVSYEH